MSFKFYAANAIMMYEEAPALEDIQGWVNTEDDKTIEKIEDIVLLDFWAYACSNCRRSIPHLKQLWNAYKDLGVAVIGVHTPRFGFERDPEHVEQAVDRLDIDYPVALDTKNTTWQQYGGQYWPRQAIIDDDGYLRFEHIGEGGHVALEEQLRRLLRHKGKELPEKVFANAEEVRESPQIISPDVYAGAEKNGEIGNDRVSAPYAPITYDDTSDAHEMNKLYLQRTWTQEDEYLELNAEGGAVCIRFTGKECNVVLAPASETAEVTVTLDGEPVPQSVRGVAVEEKEDETVVPVDRPDLYQLMAQDDVGVHEFKMICDTAGLRLYSLTFG